MPMAPPRACYLCGRIKCGGHTAPRPGFSSSARARPRIRGRRLQRERARLFAAHPLCVICEAHGRVRAATIRDHTIPLAEGGEDVPENTQALCLECSDRKTAEESKRGVRRWQEDRDYDR